jgi:DNA-binding beta-propeller fold protein YncE
MPRRTLAVLASIVTLLVITVVGAFLEAQQASTQRPPAFELDPKWPVIPNNWVLGEVSSIAVDSRDHIWVLHRPRSIPADKRANAAPPVLELDSSGKLLSSWGGDGAGFDWPEREHGISVDARGFVWISGNGGWPKPAPGGSTDDMILKFTNTGKFVMQIGKRGQSTGDGDTVNVHQPADVFVHTPTNELFVADGYGNHRIIVFDAESGKFRRMWGAFGGKPAPPSPAGPQSPGSGPVAVSAEGPSQYGLVHAVKVSNDGMVYVADRANNRIQVFTVDGTYVRQVKVTNEGGVAPVPAGFAFSADPGQQFLYVVDSGPMRVVIFDREKLAQVGAFGMRGPKPGEFDIVHHMAADSKGNLYTAEIVTNRRAQRFVFVRGR